jgi:long-subunit acyl-CoA synthetase (AMP-forming)
MSEATCGVTVFGRAEYDPELDGIGFLLPNMEAKIISDDGNEVGYGTRGEAFIRGPNIFMGYWKYNEATSSVLSPDGWLSTGDCVAVKPTGIFTVLDRKKVRSKQV